MIMNKSFERLGTLDNFISFIWTTRYYDAGDFELVCNVSDKTNQFLKNGNYVIQDGDDNVGIIESVEADIDEDMKYTIIARGRFLPAILARRIIAVQTQLSGLFSDCIYQLINDAIISPVIEARRIDNFITGGHVVNKELEKQITGSNLLTQITELCQLYDVGFNVLLTDDHKFKFDLYEGTNRSYDQNVNPWIVFSDKYDNLLSSIYIQDMATYITDVLVAGEGEGVDRKTVWATLDNPTGMDRYELYRDARQIRSNDGKVTEADYLAQLLEEGKEQCSPYKEVFSGVVEFNNVVYQRDVFMGDICSIENSKMGIYINARLIEVIESIDEAGLYSIVPTFGL